MRSQRSRLFRPLLIIEHAGGAYQSWSVRKQAVSLTKTANAPSAMSLGRSARLRNAGARKFWLFPSCLPAEPHRGLELPSPTQRGSLALALNASASQSGRLGDPAPRPEVFYPRAQSKSGMEMGAPSPWQARRVERPEAPGPAQEYAPSWCFGPPPGQIRPPPKDTRRLPGPHWK